MHQAAGHPQSPPRACTKLQGSPHACSKLQGSPPAGSPCAGARPAWRGVGYPHPFTLALALPALPGKYKSIPAPPVRGPCPARPRAAGKRRSKLAFPERTRPAPRGDLSPPPAARGRFSPAPPETHQSAPRALSLLSPRHQSGGRSGPPRPGRSLQKRATAAPSPSARPASRTRSRRRRRRCPRLCWITAAARLRLRLRCGLQLRHDPGGARRVRQPGAQDAGREPGAGAAAGGGPEAGLPHGGRLRVGQAHERRPRQRGAVPPGHGRGGRGRHRAADPLHAHPSLLLRQRHPHPARVGHAAPGHAAGRGGAGRRRAAGPPLHPGDEPAHGLLEEPGPGRGGQLLRGEPLQQPVGAQRGPAGALSCPRVDQAEGSR